MKICRWSPIRVNTLADQPGGAIRHSSDQPSVTIQRLQVLRTSQRPSVTTKAVDGLDNKGIKGGIAHRLDAPARDPAMHADNIN